MAKSVLIAAGGTGGHIFPALAFGQWILSQKKAGRVLYLSGSRPLEIEIYKSRNVEAYPLPLFGSPLGGGSVFRKCKRWLGLFRSFFYVKNLLRRERPDICFLFGGYVSLMPLLCCRFFGTPAVFHEQNACAGKVTRLASRLGIPVASGWSECRGVKTFTPAGVPVRSLTRIPRREAAAALGIDVKNGELVIGVIGGSLSSASLSALIGKAAGADWAAMRNCVFIVLGEAPPDVSSGANVRFIGRRWDMAPFYSLSDAVICRAGASTLAELAAYGTPALTIPWEGAADGHQRANALNFAAKTGNSVCFESEESKLEEEFLRLLERLSRSQDVNAAVAGKPCGAETEAVNLALWQMGEREISRFSIMPDRLR